MTVTRRALLVGSAVAGVAATVPALTGCFHHHAEWEFFSAKEADALAMLCDQIIPADDYSSASQAGVLRFIDRQLVRHYAANQDAYRLGLRQLDGICQSRFGVAPIALTQQQQQEIALQAAHDLKDFFELVRRHTMQGYYGSPRHGGNREAVSWKMLGLDEPPYRGRAQYDLTRREQS